MRETIAVLKEIAREIDRERRRDARELPKAERPAAEHCARMIARLDFARAENFYGGAKEAEAVALKEVRLAMRDFCAVIGAKFTPEGSV